MHIIGKRRIVEFFKKRATAQSNLKSWLKITKKADWKNLTDVRKVFPHADLLGNCTIFNICGNKYRLITKIFYDTKVVLIRFVLTHAEYDKKPYKNDCECR